MHFYNTKTRCQAQRGGALMVSMVLIFMMSLMGISAMRSANLDKRMSTNAVHKSRAQQAAESATELVFRNRVAISAAHNTAGALEVPVELDSHSGLEISAEVIYTGTGMVEGWSAALFRGPQFQVTGTADIANVSAKSIIVQGSYVPAPGNN